MTAKSSNAGEVIDADIGIIPVPDGVGGNPLSSLGDGEAMDSGSNMINASNANVVIYQHVRTICNDWKAGTLAALQVGGPGYVAVARGGGYGYALDVSPPSIPQPWNKISWTLDNGADGIFFLRNGGTARNYLFPVVFDAIGPDGVALALRWIKVFIQAKSAASNSLQVAVCLTPWGSTPLTREDIWAPTDLDNDLWQTVSTSEETKFFDLHAEIKLTADLPRVTLRCEATGPNPTVISVVLGALWVGWYSLNKDDYVRTICAAECREGSP